MELEQRVQALEQEVAVLKAQIQATLLDIQAQLLTNAYPSLRAESSSHSQSQAGAMAGVQSNIEVQNNGGAGMMVTPPAASSLIRKVSLDTFEAADEPAAPTIPAALATPTPAPTPASAPSKRQELPMTVPAQAFPIEIMTEDDEPQEKRRAKKKRKPAPTPKAPPVQPSAITPPAQAMDLDTLQQWVARKVEEHGVEKTGTLLDMYAQKDYLKPEVIAAMKQLLTRYEQPRGQRAVPGAPPIVMVDTMSDPEAHNINRKLILRLIAGIQNAGMRWTTHPSR